MSRVNKGYAAYANIRNWRLGQGLGTEPRQNRDRTETEPGQNRDRTGTEPGQNRDRTGTRPGQDRDKTGTRPGQDRDRAGSRGDSRSIQASATSAADKRHGAQRNGRRAEAPGASGKQHAGRQLDGRIAGGAQDGVHGIAGPPLEPTPFHAMVLFHVSDDQLDGLAPLEPAALAVGHRKGSKDRHHREAVLRRLLSCLAKRLEPRGEEVQVDAT